MQPLSSEITGALEAVTQRSSAGGSPGTTALSKSVSASAETARDWLLRQTNPAEADAALARSLTSTLGVTATLRTEWRFPQSGGSYPVVTGCAFKVDDEANIPAAIAKIEQAMTPATLDQCEGWLVMLQAATARRSDTDATAAVQYALYASELRQWPADVAKAACLSLARGKPGLSGPNWFPTLAELAQECETLAGPRHIMLARLKCWKPPEPERIPTARGIPEPTEEEKARVRQMAEDGLAKLKAAAEEAKPNKARDLPSIAGKPAEGGHVTQAMRDLITRREGARP